MNMQIKGTPTVSSIEYNGPHTITSSVPNSGESHTIIVSQINYEKISKDISEEIKMIMNKNKKK